MDITTTQKQEYFISNGDNYSFAGSFVRLLYLIIQHRRGLRRFSSLLAVFMYLSYQAHSQLTPADSPKVDSLHIMSAKAQKPANNLNTQYDFSDLTRKIIHPHKKPDTLRQRSGISIIPNIAANPSIGFQIGIKAVAGIKLGSDPKTLMSVAATSASITTKGIIYFYFNHNVFTNGNRWNWQGSIVAAKTLTPDFGIGIGRAGGQGKEDLVLTNPTRKAYVLHSLYFNFREKVYREVAQNLYVGAGVSLDIRISIEDRISAVDQPTPYKIYNERYDFKAKNYMANGLLFNIQYTTRDNQNRAYKGIYADAGIRANETWIGSTKNAVQFTSDFRKYVSLSHRNPEHVIAFWNWGSYLVNGSIPYLELPGTGRDAGYRSGRGYTVTYFKGTKYNDTEAEYRFPITKNKFLSGVAFFSLQTASDELGNKLFAQWQPGGDAGLRVLFNKATRTNLCLDYAYGKYGKQGFFLGLNEAF